MTNYEQTFKDLNSASSKEFVAWFEEEVQSNSILQSTRNFSAEQLICRFLTHECSNLRLVLSLIKSGIVARVEVTT